jgi:putative ABC transport system substrate-binding protein
MKGKPMQRREFIVGLGGAAALPMAVRAQQSALPVIGFLHSGSAASFAPMVAGFRRGLAETGYVEGQNVVIEYRWAENQNNRLPSLAADLVRHKVAVIVGNTEGTLAAKSATGCTSWFPKPARSGFLLIPNFQPPPTN